MPSKPKNPARPLPQAKSPPARKLAPNRWRQADSRWQRTVRYGWDKGGAQGGR